MSGSCCRAHNRAVYADGDPTACRELDNAGAALQVWVMNIRGSYQVVLKRSSGEFVTASSFLSAYGCGGPTASLLRSNMDQVVSAATKNPAALQRFASSGTTIVQLLKVVDAVLHKR